MDHRIEAAVKEIAIPGIRYGRWFLRHPATETVIESDIVVASPSAWAEWPESMDDSWIVRDFGDLIVAHRIAV